MFLDDNKSVVFRFKSKIPKIRTSGSVTIIIQLPNVIRTLFYYCLLIRIMIIIVVVVITIYIAINIRIHFNNAPVTYFNVNSHIVHYIFTSQIIKCN